MNLTHRYDIYAITVQSSGGERIEKYISTLFTAKRFLADKALELRTRIGIDIITDTEDCFHFLLGWEEREVKWYIKTISVADSFD